MAYWYARHKRVDLSIIPVRGCCCIDNRMACFIAGITTLITTLIAFLFVVLDIVQFADTNFIIKGGFPGLWRMPFWKGFILCDIAMFIAHIILFSFTFCLVGAISWPSKYRIYSLKPIVLNFFIVIVLHTIVELGVSTYMYSWYGLAAWRLPYLIVNIMFYIIRFVLAIWFMVISYSYILELRQELYAPVDPEARPEIEPASLLTSGVLGSRSGPN
eukprot:TsM_000148600 transcript=TsM_000148600 gene=TsM_000148600